MSLVGCRCKWLVVQEDAPSVDRFQVRDMWLKHLGADRLARAAAGLGLCRDEYAEPPEEKLAYCIHGFACSFEGR